MPVCKGTSVLRYAGLRRTTRSPQPPPLTARSAGSDFDAATVDFDDHLLTRPGVRREVRRR